MRKICRSCGSTMVAEVCKNDMCPAYGQSTPTRTCEKCGWSTQKETDRCVLCKHPFRSTRTITTDSPGHRECTSCGSTAQGDEVRCLRCNTPFSHDDAAHQSVDEVSFEPLLDTTSRHGCLAAWLALVFLANLCALPLTVILVDWRSPLALITAPLNFLMSVATIVCVVGLLRWKRWGFWVPAK